MDYEQMEIDITLESDRDLKENMQATAKFALGQIMEYQHPTKVKNRHEGYGIAAEGRGICVPAGQDEIHQDRYG